MSEKRFRENPNIPQRESRAINESLELARGALADPPQQVGEQVERWEPERWTIEHCGAPLEVIRASAFDQVTQQLREAQRRVWSLEDGMVQPYNAGLEERARSAENRAESLAQQLREAEAEHNATVHDLQQWVARAEAAEAELKRIGWGGDHPVSLQRRYEDERDAHQATVRSAEAAEERVRELEETLRFYAQQRGLGAVLASDGGMKARAALSPRGDDE